MNTKNRTRSFLALTAAVMGSLAVTANSVDAATVHSFNMDRAGVSGDVPAALNMNGLQITGETGDWAVITTGSGTATDDGVTLTFTPSDWGGTVGTRGDVGARAIRNGTFLTNEADIPWTLSGLTPNGFYNMIWYNKNLAETRHPNTGITGFDAGNGVGASAPLDADLDQNFLGVQADGTGMISGTWFLAGGTQDITAVAGVQLVEVESENAAVPEPTTFVLAVLGCVGLVGSRRRRRS